jgi:DNA-directed RNA polymerase specialized sigma24 family protein
MEGTLSLESLDMVARVRAGDVDAFAAIVLQFQSRIVQYLYRLTGDEELARDLSQKGPPTSHSKPGSTV